MASSMLPELANPAAAPATTSRSSAPAIGPWRATAVRTATSSASATARGDRMEKPADRHRAHPPQGRDGGGLRQPASQRSVGRIALEQLGRAAGSVSSSASGCWGERVGPVDERDDAHPGVCDAAARAHPTRRGRARSRRPARPRDRPAGRDVDEPTTAPAGRRRRHSPRGRSRVPPPARAPSRTRRRGPPARTTRRAAPAARQPAEPTRLSPPSGRRARRARRAPRRRSGPGGGGRTPGRAGRGPERRSHPRARTADW